MATLHEASVAVYEYAGADAVVAFAEWLEDHANHQFDWRECEPCEVITPQYHEEGTRTCLVCSTSIEK